MISISWQLRDGFWAAQAELRDDTQEFVPDYKPLPRVTGEGKSRGRDKAVAYALQDLAGQILEKEST